MADGSGGTFSRLVTDFETAQPLVSHDAFGDYLDTVDAMLRTLAMMTVQDAEITATWLRRRRPKKGRRVPWADRTKLARRARGHGRHLAKSLDEGRRFVARMREVHEEFVEKERMAAKKREEKDGDE